MRRRGTYTVTVTATDTANLTSTAVTSNVTVNSALLAVPNGPYTTSDGQAVSLAGSASGRTGPYTYARTGLPGTIQHAGAGSVAARPRMPGPTPSPPSGDRPGRGHTAKTTTTITVNDVAPTVTVGGTYTAMAGQAPALQGAATSPSPVDTAAGFTYNWNFGDGTTSSGLNLASPSHTYAAAGTYTVTVTATDTANLTSTAATSNVTVAAQSQQSSLLFQFTYNGPTIPGSVPINLNQYNASQGYGWTSFIGAASVSSGPNTFLTGFNSGSNNSFQVDLPNGTYTVTAYFGDYSGFSTDHVWYNGQSIADGSTAPGQFFEPTFQVTVTNGAMTLQFTNDGQYYPFKLNGLRIQAPMAASAGGNQSVNEGDTVNFAGAAFPGIGASYVWNFGDGTGTTGTLAPQHVYENGGVYNATLTVTDAFGDTTVATSRITVADVAPAVTISGFPRRR